MNSKAILLILINVLIIGCENESNSRIELLSFDIIAPESQAITNEGIPVLAPDINFGKIYFSFGTSYKTEKFNYRVYLSSDRNLNETDHLLASSQCNISLITCYPIKEKHCEIVQNTWLKCNFNSTRMLKLTDIVDYTKSGISTFLILEVCPWGSKNSAQCDWQAHPLRIEPKCSQYRMVECLDQDPLNINSFKIISSITDEDNLPLLTHTINKRQKFWLQWQSSWLSQEYTYKVEILKSLNGIEQIETLTQGVCNEHVSCYPGRDILCEYYARNSTGQLTCQGSSEHISINQIDSSHPYETVDLKIKLTAYDEINQSELILMGTIRIQGES